MQYNLKYVINQIICSYIKAISISRMCSFSLINCFFILIYHKINICKKLNADCFAYTNRCIEYQYITSVDSECHQGVTTWELPKWWTSSSSPSQYGVGTSGFNLILHVLRSCTSSLRTSFCVTSQTFCSSNLSTTCSNNHSLASLIFVTFICHSYSRVYTQILTRV